MNRISLIIILFLFYGIVHTNCLAQEQNEASELRTDIVHEKISLFTDRSMYCTGENVFFKATYSVDKYLGELNWSTILYVEIIKQNGSPVIQEKFALNENNSVGALKIPKNLLSGIYYIKAYTKWMRNYSTSNYSYCRIKIINPEKSAIEVIEGYTDPKASLEQKNLQSKNAITINPTKLSFARREKVEVNLIPRLDKSFTSYCISVTKDKYLNASEVISSRLHNDSLPAKHASFFPELNGISISGRVVNSADSIPEENARVILALVNNESYLSGFNTNLKGEFFFTFPYSEKTHDFYLHAKKQGKIVNVLLNEDFCSKLVSLPYERFSLNDSEKLLAKEICLNAQISESYSKALNKKNTVEKTKKTSFYGTADRVIYTKDFIDLPFLEEFIYELTQEISVIRKKDYVSIRTSKSIFTDETPYLVLVDNIPAENLDAVLKTETIKVERLEIINSPYVIGNSIYGGVLNIFTKKKDMAGIELPSNAMFFNYSLLSESVVPNLTSVEDNRIPDRRNTLFWNPEYSLNAESKNNFSFYTSDVPGKYSIVIRGTTEANEKVLIAQKEFIVE